MTPHDVDSLKTGLQFLRKCKEDAHLYDPERFYRYRRVLDRNCLLTILISDPDDWEEHEITLYHHATNEVTSLGYFAPYKNVHFHYVPYSHPFRFLSRFTQDGNYVVLLGPIYKSVSKERIPLIAIYQIAPSEQIFEKKFQESDVPFIDCNPIGIAMSEQSITKGEYHVAILVKCMALILLNVVTLEYSTLELESVSPHYHTDFKQRSTDCLSFSPDGQILTMFCYMDDESMNACLVIDAGRLEPLFWMATDTGCYWQQWLFPMFSACGTKMLISTKLYGENDESKYEVMFYKISRILSLKNLCRVVILEFVRPAMLHELPLPQEMIVFLSGSRPTQTFEHNQTELYHQTSIESHDDKIQTCKCNLL